jgi:hypothetical protein
VDHISKFHVTTLYVPQEHTDETRTQNYLLEIKINAVITEDSRRANLDKLYGQFSTMKRVNIVVLGM